MIFYLRESFQKLIFYTVVNNLEKNCLRDKEIKREGRSPRVIKRPNKRLKDALRLTKDFLKLQLNNRHLLFQEKGSCIFRNANKHKESTNVLNIDIKSFFNTVNRKRVKDVFKEIGFSDKFSETMTRLTTIDFILPQGFPTSSIISEVALFIVDKRIKLYCSKNNLKYTRYVDDITISWNGDIFGFKRKKIEKKIKIILKNSGYSTQERKIVHFGLLEEKEITGVYIKNGKLKTIYDKLEGVEKIEKLKKQMEEAFTKEGKSLIKQKMQGVQNFKNQVLKFNI